MTETVTLSTEMTADQDSGAVGFDGSPPDFNLRISSDKVKVLLDCPDPHRELTSTVGRIIDGLKALELPQYPDEEFITQVMHNICSPGRHLVDAILMMGEEAVQPIDGRLDWSKDYFADGWETDGATETVDFWNKLDNRSVSAGEKLLEMHPSIDGEAGLNVFGNKIAVNKPDRVRVRCGKGVVENDLEGGVKVFTAEINGRVRFADNIVAVDDVYVIKGNVNLETGNISHTGTLQIDGDVELGASIEANGDIIVKGMLEPSTVQAGGSLTVNGGIVGSEEYTINIGGDLQAKYIKDATIRSGGNILVTGEINHCDIESRGKVDASRGRIAGGRTIARGGITVGEAGASGASQTLLAAGYDPTLGAKVKGMKEKIRQMEKARIKLRQAIDAIAKKSGGLNEDERAVVAGLDAKARALGQAVADGELAMRRLINDATIGAREEIFMLRECWSGTTVQLGEYKTFVRSSIMKPRLVKRFKTQVRVVPMGDNNQPDETELPAEAGE